LGTLEQSCIWFGVRNATSLSVNGNLSAPKELLKRFDEKYLPPLLPLRLEVSEFLKIKQHHFKGL